VVIKPNVSTTKQRELVNCIADFLDALTGGSFGAEVRASDPSKSKLVYSTAAELVAHLRRTSPRVTITAIILALIAVLGFLAIVFHPFSKPLSIGIAIWG
jgi:hypothetical protein